MKKLSNILPQGYYQSIFGDEHIWVSGLELDSRKVQEGNLFAALQGSEQDGSQYIADAIAKGAK
ncbi:MAG: Mur ligase domain-containing protein, partial [Bacteroidia bacterium]